MEWDTPESRTTAPHDPKSVDFASLFKKKIQTIIILCIQHHETPNWTYNKGEKKLAAIYSSFDIASSIQLKTIWEDSTKKSREKKVPGLLIYVIFFKGFQSSVNSRQYTSVLFNIILHQYKGVYNQYKNEYTMVRFRLFLLALFYNL